VEPGGADPWTRPRGLWARLRPFLREPLLSFVLAGTAVFGIDHALRRDERIIRITPSVRDEVARGFQGRVGRAPNGEEEQAELERWKQEQALYREGKNMGLLEDDPMVRAHVASKLLQVARERDVLPDPTEAELRTFLKEHWNAFALPPAYDFEQVFVSQSRGDALPEAQRVLSQLKAGASPEGLGDPFPRGTRFTHEPLSYVSTMFGEEAAKELPGYAMGEWHLVSNPRGFHALRVTATDRGEPDFDKLRPALVAAVNAERRESAAQAYVRQIESHYRFVTSE
jgi:peptidyl-prolyl cis-trans isomerase C